MRIKEVETKTGLTRKAIRYYEEVGLINVDRGKESYKDYLYAHVEELIKIKQLRLLDFSIIEIKEYLINGNAEILNKKIEECEYAIVEAGERKKLIKKLLSGACLNDLDVEEELEKRKNRQAKAIKINLLFGCANLVACVVAFFLSIKLNISSELMFLGYLLIVISLSIETMYRIKIKAQGEIVLKRRLLQTIIILAANFSAYLMCWTTCMKIKVDHMYIDWYHTMSEFFVLVIFVGLAILLVILSFMSIRKRDMEYIIKNAKRE